MKEKDTKAREAAAEETKTTEKPEQETKKPDLAAALAKAVEAEAKAEAKTADLEKKLAAAADKIALSDKQYDRLQADFDNFRRRTRNEAAGAKEAMTADIVKEFLPVLDNFHLALSHMKKDEKGAAYVKGFEMLQKQLEKILKDMGVTEIAAEKQEFDPHFHEAVMQAPSADLPDDTIAMVFQKGYKLNDKVIRPAKVQVVKNG